jgi:hypothetical protein
MERRVVHNRSPLLRRAHLKSPLATLSCCVQVVLVFLSQSITDEVIESHTGGVGHCFHQLGVQSSFEALNLESMKVLVRVRVPWVSFMNSPTFILISPR